MGELFQRAANWGIGGPTGMGDLEEGAVPGKQDDYDSVQPYFLYDKDEDHFHDSQQQGLHSQLQPPAPSEDIWKKFELLPTLPRSPRRRSHLSCCLFPSSVDQQERVTEFLGRDLISQTFVGEPNNDFMKSIIIHQDCMWSCFSATAKLEKVMSNKLSSFQAFRKEMGSASTVAAAPACQTATPTNCYLPELGVICIDPSMVFPYLLTESLPKDCPPSKSIQLLTCMINPPATRSSSSSDSVGEQEDEDDKEDEEGDDEAIDVTIEKRQPSEKKSDLINQRCHSPLVLKKCHVPIHQHNYTASHDPINQHDYAVSPSTRTVPSKTDHSTATRIKRENRSRILKQSYSNLKCSRASDTEGNDKRQSHRVLERRRRRELKLSLFALRVQIPEVARNKKVPKIVIIQKATEFSISIQVQEHRLIAEKEQLRQKGEQLKHKLEQLQNSPV